MSDENQSSKLRNEECEKNNESDNQSDNECDNESDNEQDNIDFIIDMFIEFKEKMNNLEKKVDKLLHIFENDVGKSCKKMSGHIDFVENVYENVKYPLTYVCNKINRLTGNDEEKLLGLDDARQDNSENNKVDKADSILGYNSDFDEVDNHEYDLPCNFSL